MYVSVNLLCFTPNLGAARNKLWLNTTLRNQQFPKTISLFHSMSHNLYTNFRNMKYKKYKSKPLKRKKWKYVKVTETKIVPELKLKQLFYRFYAVCYEIAADDETSSRPGHATNYTIRYYVSNSTSEYDLTWRKQKRSNRMWQVFFLQNKTIAQRRECKLRMRKERVPR
jgi:hypothetical protein